MKYLFVSYYTEEVWKVARYTSAAPMYFSEMDNYVDGGVMANNPCEYGLTRIQHYFYLRQQQLPIALVVSIGTGIYPPERIGAIDTPSCVTPYRQWLKLRPNQVSQRVRNFVTLVRHMVRHAAHRFRNVKYCISSLFFSHSSIPSFCLSLIYFSLFVLSLRPSLLNSWCSLKQLRTVVQSGAENLKFPSSGSARGYERRLLQEKQILSSW